MLRGWLPKKGTRTTSSRWPRCLFGAISHEERSLCIKIFYLIKKSYEFNINYNVLKIRGDKYVIKENIF